VDVIAIPKRQTNAGFISFIYQFYFFTVYNQGIQTPYQGPVSRKSRELFGPEKPVIKLQSAYFEKLIF